jgi:hypothetical protein
MVQMQPYVIKPAIGATTTHVDKKACDQNVTLEKAAKLRRLDLIC